MTSIRELYKRHGVSGYYANYHSSYVNPHECNVKYLLSNLDVSNFKDGIDFSCGDGLVSRTLPNIKWVGVDPYMSERYSLLTGNECIKANMEQVAKGVIKLPKVDVIVCSYCFDIFEKSYMEIFLWQLSLSSAWLVVIRGNKKLVDSKWWKLTSTQNQGRTCMTVYSTRDNVQLT